MKKSDKALVNAMELDEAKEWLRVFIDLLDEGDEDDTFGTEGWRHRSGWDEE